MQRAFAITMFVTLALTACGGGPPPLPQSAMVAPTATEHSAVVISAVEEASQKAVAAPDDPARVMPDVSVTAVPVTVNADAIALHVNSAPALRPLDLVACEQLWGEVAHTLGVEVQRSDAPFADERVGVGSSCRLVATGNGAQFKPFVDVAADLRSLLTQRDWSEDHAFAADGPNGTSTAFRRGADVALVSVGWQPDDGVNCDGPIAQCDVPAEQQRITVSLDLVEPAD